MENQKASGCSCLNNSYQTTHFGNYNLHDAVSEIREKSGERKVLLKGMNLLPCYHGMKACQLEASVKTGLRRIGTERMTAVQTCSWPHITSGRNTIIVTTELGLTKSSSYLVPVASRAMKNLELVKQARGYGPLGIILCTSNDVANAVATLLNILVERKLDIYHGFTSDPHLETKLKLRPDFVVCEPDFFNFVKQKYPDYFELKRLKFFIVDDCFGSFDRNFENTNQVVQTVVNEVMHSGKGRAWNLQTIFCSRIWVDTMYDAYMDLFPKPVQVMEFLTNKVGVGHCETIWELELVQRSKSHKVTESRHPAELVEPASNVTGESVDLPTLSQTCGRPMKFSLPQSNWINLQLAPPICRRRGQMLQLRFPDHGLESKSSSNTN